MRGLWIVGFAVLLGAPTFAQQDVDTFNQVTSTTLDKDGAIVSETRDAVAPSQTVIDLALGYCAREVHGTSYGIEAKPQPYKTENDDWREMLAFQTTNDLKLFNPRQHTQIDIIVDMHPNGASCWMQAAGVETGPAADAIEAAITMGSALSIAQQGLSGPGVSSTLYQGVPKVGEPLPILMLHRYGTDKTTMISMVIGLAEVSAAPAN
ncbi:MAG: hypothetical protein AAFR74_08595 [Pseudomonadota bacterium]